MLVRYFDTIVGILDPIRQTGENSRRRRWTGPNA